MCIWLLSHVPNQRGNQKDGLKGMASEFCSMSVHNPDGHLMIIFSSGILIKYWINNTLQHLGRSSADFHNIAGGEVDKG